MQSTLLKFILLLNLECSLSQSTAKSYGLFQFILHEGNKSYDSCSAVDPSHNYSLIIEKAKIAEINNEDVEFMTITNFSNFTLQWSVINNRSTKDLSNSWSCLKKSSLQDVYLKFLNEFVILGQRRNIFHNLKKVPDAQMLGLIQQSWINWTYFEEAFTHISKAQNYTLNPYDIITAQGWSEFHDLIQNQNISQAAWFDDYMVRKNSTNHDLDQLDILQFWQIFMIYIYDPKEQLLQNFDWMKAWSPNMWGFYRSQAQQIQIDQARIIELIESNKTYLELDNLTESYKSIILQVTGFDENNTYYHGFKDLSFTPQNYEDDLRYFMKPKKNMILRSNLVFSGQNISVTYDFVDTICREQTKPIGVRFSLSYANQNRDIYWDNLQYFDANISQSEQDECVVEQELQNNGKVKLDGVRDLIDYSSLNLLIGKFKDDELNYVPGDKSKNRTRFLIEERENHSFDIRVISQYEGVMLDEISHQWETQLPLQFDEGHISGQSFLFQSFKGQVVFQPPNITSSALLVIQTDMIFPNKYVRTCWDYVYVIGAEEQSVYPPTECDSESNWTQIFKCVNIISQLSLTSTSSLNIDCNEWSCSTHGLCTQEHPYIRCDCFEGFKGKRCSLDEKIFDQRMEFILFALNKALNMNEVDLTLVDDLLDMVFKIINLVDYQSEITFKKMVQLMTSLIDQLNTHQRIGRSMVICQQIQDYMISSKSDVLVIGRPLFDFLQGLRVSLLNEALNHSLKYVEVSNQNSIIRIEQIDKNTTEKYSNFTTTGSLFSFGKKLNSPVVQILTQNIPEGAVYVSILLLNAHNYGIVDDEIDSGLFDMNFHQKDGQPIQPSQNQQYEVLITIPMLKTIRSPQNIACFHLDGHSLSSDLIDILMYDITKQYVICQSKTIKKTVIAQRKKNPILEHSQNSSWIDALNFAPIILPQIITLSLLLLS